MNKITESILKHRYFLETGKFISGDDFEKRKKSLYREYLKEIFDPEDSEKYDLSQESSGAYGRFLKIGSDEFDVRIFPSHSRLFVGFFEFIFTRIRSEFLARPKLAAGGDTRKYTDELNAYEYGVTNSHNPIEVLKTMQSILYRFIKQHSPTGVMFRDYDEGRREKVYQYIAKKVAAKSGYTLVTKENYFFLFKQFEDAEKFGK